MDEAIERRATKKSASKADATIVSVGCAVGGTFLGQYAWKICALSWRLRFSGGW